MARTRLFESGEQQRAHYIVCQGFFKKGDMGKVDTRQSAERVM